MVPAGALAALSHGARGGREVPLPCSCSQLFKEAGTEDPVPPPPPQHHGPAPGCAHCGCCRWLLGCRGWGGERGTCAGFRSPPREATCPPAQLARACGDPRARCTEALLVSVCPADPAARSAAAAAAGAGGHHSPESALPGAALALAQQTAHAERGSLLSRVLPAPRCHPGVEPAAGSTGEPHARSPGTPHEWEHLVTEDGRLATSLGIAAVSHTGYHVAHSTSGWTTRLSITGFSGQQGALPVEVPVANGWFCPSDQRTEGDTGAAPW